MKPPLRPLPPIRTRGRRSVATTSCDGSRSLATIAVHSPAYRRRSRTGRTTRCARASRRVGLVDVLVPVRVLVGVGDRVEVNWSISSCPWTLISPMNVRAISRFQRVYVPASWTSGFSRAPEPETNEEFGTEEMIVEVRGNRLCTVFPNSVHVSGEAIAFDDRHDNCQSTWSYSKPVYRATPRIGPLHGSQIDLALMEYDDARVLIEAIAGLYPGLENATPDWVWTASLTKPVQRCQTLFRYLEILKVGLKFNSHINGF